MVLPFLSFLFWSDEHYHRPVPIPRDMRICYILVILTFHHSFLIHVECADEWSLTNLLLSRTYSTVSTIYISPKHYHHHVSYSPCFLAHRHHPPLSYDDPNSDLFCLPLREDGDTELLPIFQLTLLPLLPLHPFVVIPNTNEPFPVSPFCTPPPPCYILHWALGL